MPVQHSVLAGRQVLVVDDNATIRADLDSQLTALGVAATTVGNGAAALDALRAAVAAGRPFDLALLDFNMPGVDGRTLARRIRAEPWGTQIRLGMLLASGNERVAARAAGVDTHLTKPVRHDRLGRIVAAALADAPPAQRPAATAVEEDAAVGRRAGRRGQSGQSAGRAADARAHGLRRRRRQRRTRSGRAVGRRRVRGDLHGLPDAEARRVRRDAAHPRARGREQRACRSSQ